MTTTTKQRPGLRHKNHGAKNKEAQMRLSKVEVERRSKTVLEYFTKNPEATGEAVNKALADGTLTGKPEPRMNIAGIYSLRKQARQALATPLHQVEAHNSRRFSQISVNGQTRQQIQSLLGEMRGQQISDLTIHQDGRIEISRMTRSEEMVSA